MSTIIGEISIPADDQGFVLMQCPLCREFFKIKPEDYHAENVIEIWCPSCGLKAENYFTDDVIELALKKTKNYANDLIYSEMKKWEKKFKGSFISFKAGKKPKHEEEYPIKYDYLIINQGATILDLDGNIGDYTLAVTDPYPGDITRDENGNILDGSKTSPYQINCIEDLVAFSNMTNGTGVMFENGTIKEITGSNTFFNQYIVVTRDLNFKSNASYVNSQRTDFGDINENGENETLITELTTGKGFKPIASYKSGEITVIKFLGHFSIEKMKL